MENEEAKPISKALSKYMAAMARKSHKVTKDKQGKDFYKRIGKLGAAARWKGHKPKPKPEAYKLL